MCAKFRTEIFRGNVFTRVEFPIFLLILAWALQQCGANAVPVIESLGCARKLTSSEWSLRARKFTEQEALLLQRNRATRYVS